MNEANYAYLKDQLRFTGFGDKLYGELKEKLQTPRNFSLLYGKEYGNDAVAAILRFKKSAESGLVFFTDYTLHLSAKGLEPRQQTFYLRGMGGITLDKGYNLLSGRAVLQEFPNRKGWKFSWVRLDLSAKNNKQNYPVRQFEDQFGYTFGMAVSKFSIFPMGIFSSDKIISSLQKGDLLPTVFRRDNGEVKLFMTYDPAAKDVILYDKEMRRLGTDEMQAFIVPGRLVNKEKQVAGGAGLLPKKREIGHKKGLSV